MHLVALGALIFARLPSLVLVLFALLIAVYGLRLDRRVSRLTVPGTVCAMRWDAERLWIQRRDCPWEECELSPGSLVHPLGMLLELITVQGHRCRLVLLPDALEGQGFRRLLVVLRYRLSSRQPQS